MNPGFSMRNGDKKGLILDLITESTGRDIRGLPAEAHLRNDVGLDSFAVVELLYELEMKLSVRVTDSMLRKLITLGDLFHLVEQVEISKD